MPTDLISAPSSTIFDRQKYEALQELERRGSIRPEEKELLGGYREQAKAELARRQGQEAPAPPQTFMDRLRGAARNVAPITRGALETGLPLAFAAPFVAGGPFSGGASVMAAPAAGAAGFAAAEAGSDALEQFAGIQKPTTMTKQAVKGVADFVKGLEYEAGPVAANKALSVVPKIPGVKQLIGFLTGKGSRFAEEAAKGTPAFESQMEKRVPIERTVDTLKEAVGVLGQQQEKAIENTVAKLSSIPGKINPKEVSEVATDWMSANGVTQKFGTGKKATFVYEFPEKLGISSKNQRAFSEIVDEIRWAQDTKLSDLNNLRNRIDKMKGLTPTEQKTLNGFKDQIENIITKRFPEYKQLLAESSSFSHLIKEIDASFRPGDKNSDAILKRLMTSMKNGELSAQHLEELGAKTGVNVTGETAGAMARNWMPDLTRHHLTAYGGLGTLLYSTHLLQRLGPVLAPLIMAASSPKLVGEFLNVVATTQGQAQSQLMRSIAFGLGPAGRKEAVDLTKEYALPEEETPAPEPEKKPEPKKKYTRKDRKKDIE